jgi:hypothetical protein
MNLPADFVDRDRDVVAHLEPQTTDLRSEKWCNIGAKHLAV